MGPLGVLPSSRSLTEIGARSGAWPAGARGAGIA